MRAYNSDITVAEFIIALPRTLVPKNYSFASTLLWRCAAA